MSLDEFTDEQSAAILKTVDEFAKDRATCCWTVKERVATDMLCRAYLERTFKDRKDINDVYLIYEAKIKAYTRR